MSRGRGMVGRLLLESLVIMGSILAAFALDTWWDGVQQRDEEQVVLEALHDEFVIARSRVDFYRGMQVRILGSVSAVADSVEGALDRGVAHVTLPDTALGLAYIPPTTSMTLSALDGLIASGRLGIIRDPELRAALGAWGAEVEELNEEEVDSRALAYGDLDRVLRARMNTAGLWATGAGLIEDRLTEGSAIRVRDVPVDTEVLGVFTLRESLLVHTAEEFEPLVAAIDSVIALIERSR